MSNLKFDKYRVEVNDRILEKAKETEISQYIGDFLRFFKRLRKGAKIFGLLQLDPASPCSV